MKKMKFDIGLSPEEAAKVAGGFAGYSGPQPPKGVYKVQMKQLRVKTNKNGDPMLNGVLEIQEPKSSGKSEYNGYGFWFNINITQKSASFINNWLDAFSFPRKAFWSGGMVVDDNENPPTVAKIGTKNITGEETCLVNTKIDTYQGEQRLVVAGAGFMPPKQEEDVWDESDEDDEDEADESGESDEEDEESEESDESDDDEEDDEDEEISLEELKTMSRAELKGILSQYAPGVKVLKTYDNDQLAQMVFDALSSSGSDDDDDDDESAAPF